MARIQAVAPQRHQGAKPRLADRPTLVTFAALMALAALAWAWLSVTPMPMPATSGGLYTRHYALHTFTMWFVMMVGMMTSTGA